MVIRDRVNYSRQGDGVMLAEALSEHVSRFDAGEAMPGDIIMFNMRGSPVHVGIATDVGMVHTHAGIGRVVEHALDWPWRRRAIAAWGLR